MKNVTDVWKLQVRPTGESGSSVAKKGTVAHTPTVKTEGARLFLYPLMPGIARFFGMRRY
jgi:hypothetical protein